MYCTVCVRVCMCVCVDKLSLLQEEALLSAIGLKAEHPSSEQSDTNDQSQSDMISFSSNHLPSKL